MKFSKNLSFEKNKLFHGLLRLFILLIAITIVFQTNSLAQQKTIKKITKNIYKSANTGNIGDALSYGRNLQMVNQSLGTLGTQIPPEHWDWLSPKQKNVVIEAFENAPREVYQSNPDLPIQIDRIKNSSYFDYKQIRKPVEVPEDQWKSTVKEVKRYRKLIHYQAEGNLPTRKNVTQESISSPNESIALNSKNIRSSRVKTSLLKTFVNPSEHLLLDAILQAEYTEYFAKSKILAPLDFTDWKISLLNKADKVHLIKHINDLKNQPSTFVHAEKISFVQEWEKNLLKNVDFDYQPDDIFERKYGKEIQPRAPNKMTSIEKTTLYQKSIASSNYFQSLSPEIKKFCRSYTFETFEKLHNTLKANINRTPKQAIASGYRVLTQYVTDMRTFDILSNEQHQKAMNQIRKELATINLNFRDVMTKNQRSSFTPKSYHEWDLEIKQQLKATLPIREDIAVVNKITSSPNNGDIPKASRLHKAIDRRGGIFLASNIKDVDFDPYWNIAGSSFMTWEDSLSFDSSVTWGILYDSSQQKLILNNETKMEQFFYKIPSDILEQLYAMALAGEKIIYKGSLNQENSEIIFQINPLLSRYEIGADAFSQLTYSSRVNRERIYSGEENPVYPILYQTYNYWPSDSSYNLTNSWIDEALESPNSIIEEYLSSINTNEKVNHSDIIKSLLTNNNVGNTLEDLYQKFSFSKDSVSERKYELIQKLWRIKGRQKVKNDPAQQRVLAQSYIIDWAEVNKGIDKGQIQLWCALEKMNRKVDYNEIRTEFYWKLQQIFGGGNVIVQFKQEKTKMDLANQTIHLDSEWFWRLQFPSLRYGTVKNEKILTGYEYNFEDSYWQLLSNRQISALSTSQKYLAAIIEYSKLYSLLRWGLEGLSTGTVEYMDFEELY